MLATLNNKIILELVFFTRIMAKEKTVTIEEETEQWILVDFHFTKQWIVIQAESYEQALEKLQLNQA